MSAVPNEQPDAAPATALRIDWDQPCIGCGYNLRTLQRDGVCPECGTWVSKTFQPRERWLERPLTWRGCLLANTLALYGPLLLLGLLVGPTFSMGTLEVVAVAPGVLPSLAFARFVEISGAVRVIIGLATGLGIITIATLHATMRAEWPRKVSLWLLGVTLFLVLLVLLVWCFGLGWNLG